MASVSIAGSPRSSTSEGIHCSIPKNAGDRKTWSADQGNVEILALHVQGPPTQQAMNDASMGMIKWLESEKKIARLDAYGLASVRWIAALGVPTARRCPCLMPKSIWVASASSADEHHDSARAMRPASFQDPWFWRFV